MCLDSTATRAGDCDGRVETLPRFGVELGETVGGAAAVVVIANTGTQRETTVGAHEGGGFIDRPGEDGPMAIELRCYGRVKRALGDRRVTVSLENERTVGDLLDTLEATYETFDRDALSGPSGLVIMRDRRHLEEASPIADGEVIAISDSPMVEG